MADEPKQPESVETEKAGKPAQTPTTPEAEAAAADAAPVSLHDAETVSDAPSLDADEVLDGEPDFADSPLESLIFTLRATSSRELVVEVPAEEEIVPPVDHPKGLVEVPIHLSPLPDPQEVFIDPGLPIPETYDTDLISALVQDPFRMYVYWEVRPDTLTSITRLFSTEEVKTFRPVLRLTDKKTGEEEYFQVQYPGNDWLSVSPDRTYIVEFGVYSKEFGFIRLMAAPEITTPRGTVAPEIAPEPEYQISASRFKRVLKASGFAAQIGSLPQETLAEWLPPTVTQAFEQAGIGQPLQNIHVEALPLSVRSIVEEIMATDDGEMAANTLLHYLPAVLRDAYLAFLAAEGKRTGIRNIERLAELAGSEEFEEGWSDWEWSEYEEEGADDFFAPGLLRFGVGSSAGSDLGSLRGKARRRVPRRVPRTRPVQQERPTPWLPSMDRPDSSGGRNRLLPMDFDL
ncbi:MAG: DUF4912 domain-containing protein [Blastocatellia bacterium]|nr:DUF4912 domain-containing protein [Blastocatellia bacterium]